MRVSHNSKIIFDNISIIYFKNQQILDLFDNYTNLEFNKINILKQGVLTPCIDKKNLGYRTYLLFLLIL